METREQAAFFSLLRSGLWENNIDRIDLFPLNQDEWNWVLEQGRIHTVEGLLFQGIQKLPMNLTGSKAHLFELAVRVEKIEQRNQLMNDVLAEQWTYFKDLGINAFLLKGQGLANCYSQPNLRVCGDIDWYLPVKEDYNRLIEHLNKRGIEVKSDTNYSSNFIWNGFEIDLHQKLFDLHNPFNRGYLKDFELKESNNFSLLAIHDQKIKVPSIAIQLVQTSSHILKHLLSFGIGLRQLCDIARLYYHYSNQLVTLGLSKIFKRLDIYSWIKQLNKLLIDYLALPADLIKNVGYSSKNADWMMKDILQSGNFGYYDNDYIQHENTGILSRRRTFKKISGNIFRYLPYAPMEAISFPIAHYFSRSAIK